MSTTPDADEQRRIDAVTDAIRSLDVAAPEGLRTRVAAMAAEAGSSPAPARRRPPLALAGGLLTAVAAVAVALLLVVGGGSDDDRGAPASVRQVAAVALRPATEPAPAARPGGTLDASVAPVSFPDWQARPPGPAGRAWRATGARADSVGGRDVTTVFYDAPGGQRVGYAIAAGDRLPVAGGRYVRRDGVDTWVYDVDGAPAVMWYRGGRTCVVAGRGVDVDTLVTLAASDPA